MWLCVLMLACSGGQTDDGRTEGECSANCTTLSTVPSDDATVPRDVAVSVSIEPSDRAFDAVLYGPDGEELGGVTGSGTEELVLAVNQLPLGEHELFVRTSCDPAPAAPCNDTTVQFTVADDLTTMTTTTTTTMTTRERDIISTPEVVSTDVLFVVDDSCSMADKQTLLSESIPGFMEYFLGSGVDYHIGAVTTTPDGGELASFGGTSWIDSNTPNATNVFMSLAMAGTGGDSNAQGLTTSRAALEAAYGGVNDGFTRPDASLIVVVISDSDDKGPLSSADYVSWIEGLGRSQVDFVPIAPMSGYEVGTTYFEVADALGSPSFDLSDLGPAVISDVGQLTLQLETTFCTSVPAAAGSLEVEVHRAAVVLAFDEGEDWAIVEVDGSLGTCIELLEYVPDPGSEVHLIYDAVE